MGDRRHSGKSGLFHPHQPAQRRAAATMIETLASEATALVIGVGIGWLIRHYAEQLILSKPD